MRMGLQNPVPEVSTKPGALHSRFGASGKPGPIHSMRSLITGQASLSNSVSLSSVS